MKTAENINHKLFSDAGIYNNSTVYSKHINFSFNENQAFVVPWQMTEKQTTEKVEEQVFRYSHF